MSSTSLKGSKDDEDSSGHDSDSGGGGSGKVFKRAASSSKKSSRREADIERLLAQVYPATPQRRIRMPYSGQRLYTAFKSKCKRFTNWWRSSKFLARMNPPRIGINLAALAEDSLLTEADIERYKEDRNKRQKQVWAQLAKVLRSDHRHVDSIREAAVEDVRKVQQFFYLFKSKYYALTEQVRDLTEKNQHLIDALLEARASVSRPSTPMRRKQQSVEIAKHSIQEIKASFSHMLSGETSEQYFKNVLEALEQVQKEHIEGEGESSRPTSATLTRSKTMVGALSGPGTAAGAGVEVGAGAGFVAGRPRSGRRTTMRKTKPTSAATAVARFGRPSSASRATKLALAAAATTVTAGSPDSRPSSGGSEPPADNAIATSSPPLVAPAP